MSRRATPGGNPRRPRVSRCFVGYAPSLPMAAGLVACPFCREMFEAGEHAACPECDVALVATHRLPKTQAELDAEAARTPPDEIQLPWAYAGRGRGLIVGLAAAGLAAFLLPWVRESIPERQVLSGLDLARRLGWLWAPAVAWFVMIPLVITRRSVARMRGARVAIGFLAAVALATVVVRVLNAPASTALRTIRFAWGEGLWATAAIGAATLFAAARFGGPAHVPTPDRPSATPAPRARHETLH